MLDSGAVNNIAGDTYKQLLTTLFDKIENANNINSNNTEQNIIQNIQETNNIQENNNQQNVSQITNEIKTEVNNTIEKQCEIGFWLSILGIVYGLVLQIIVFSFAIRGLKSKKRTKAIITIVISILSILIGLIKYILS